MNKRRISIIGAFVLMLLAFLVGIHDSGTSKQSVSHYIPTTATPLGNETKPPSSLPIDIINLLFIASSIVTILTGTLGLLKWLEWRSKYGKSRTPIVMPGKSKD